MRNDRHLVITEFSRYIVAGGLAFACDFLAYWSLVEVFGWNYLWANVIGFCLGLTVNYLLSIFWVFGQRVETSRRREFVIFTSIGLFNLGLGELCLWSLVDLGGVHHAAGKLAITALVFLSNFCMRKVLLFHVRPA